MKAFILARSMVSHPKVDAILGPTWITRQVQRVRDARRIAHALSPSSFVRTTGPLAHPLLSEAYASEIRDTRGAVGGSRTPLTDMLESDLQALSATGLPSNLAARLRTAQNAIKVMYELHIAAWFC